MNVYVILLRILHIFAGVFWVGAAATFVLFIAPSAEATRPESQKFVNYLLQQRRFLTAILIAATLGILAGLLLYWQDSAGFQGSWILSPTGLGFTSSALAALLAYGVLHMARRNLKRLGMLAQQIQSSGQPPTPDQAAQLQQLQQRQSRLGSIGLILLALALLGMAVARYL
jgi:uncharacterized membrane protein